MGFDIAATRAKKEIDEYLFDNGLNKNNTVIWLTGHSRGAAVSGIIATYLIADGYTVYAYNFATPNQVEVSDSSEIEYIKCPGVFNIINTDDLVPCLPLKAWNFVKYGEPIYYDGLSIIQKYQWNKKKIDWSYQTSNFLLNCAISAFENISDNRNSCYIFLYDENKNIIKGMTKIYYKTAWDAKRFKATLYNADFYKRLPKHMLNYIYFGSDLSVDEKVVIYQKPIFFMQVLAGVCASDEYYNTTDFISGIYSAPMYSDAKMGMALYSFFSDFLNPHFVDGYIIISES